MVLREQLTPQGLISDRDQMALFEMTTPASFFNSFGNPATANERIFSGGKISDYNKSLSCFEIKQKCAKN